MFGSQHIFYTFLAFKSSFQIIISYCFQYFSVDYLKKLESYDISMFFQYKKTMLKISF